MQVSFTVGFGFAVGQKGVEVVGFPPVAGKLWNETTMQGAYKALAQVPLLLRSLLRLLVDPTQP